METISTLKRDLEDAVESQQGGGRGREKELRAYFWLDLSYDLNLTMSSYRFDNDRKDGASADNNHENNHENNNGGDTPMQDSPDLRKQRRSSPEATSQLEVRGPSIDRRILPSARFGEVLASYHWHDNFLNLMFGDWNRSDMMFCFRDHSLTKLLPQQGRCRRKQDRTSYLAAEYGEDMLHTIMNNMKENYNDHDDAFRSNKRTKSNHNGSDEPGAGYNDFCKGPIGRDIGMPFTYPLAAALVYAVQGQAESVHEILKELDLFWDAYVDTLISQGKDESYICSAYRNGVGWCGWFLYLSFYRIEAYSNVLPVTGVCDEDQEIVLDSIGLIGLRMMSWGFGRYEEDLALEHLCRRIDDALKDEIDTLFAVDIVNRVHVERRYRRSGRWRVRNGSLYCADAELPFRNPSVVVSRFSTAAGGGSRFSSAAAAAAMAAAQVMSAFDTVDEDATMDEGKSFNCQTTVGNPSLTQGKQWIY